MRRREFGSVRQLPSGRWQARYPGVDGRLSPAAPCPGRGNRGCRAWSASAA